MIWATTGLYGFMYWAPDDVAPEVDAAEGGDGVDPEVVDEVAWLETGEEVVLKMDEVKGRNGWGKNMFWTCFGVKIIWKKCLKYRNMRIICRCRGAASDESVMLTTWSLMGFGGDLKFSENKKFFFFWIFLILLIHLKFEKFENLKI